METAALAMAALGHACWDNVLVWMVNNDPDASIIHMHWLRMVFMAIFLSIVSYGVAAPKQSTSWWLLFSLVGWTIPSCMYTICVMLTGYRIAISVQPFIPMLVALRIGAPMTFRRTNSLTISLLGTLILWITASWQYRDGDLWSFWVSLLCVFVQVFAQQQWFVMMHRLAGGHVRAVALGACIGAGIFFFVMIMWTPQHLQSAYMEHWDAWLFILVTSAVTAGCKFWALAVLSKHVSGDGMAIFECVHPLATLCSDIVRGHDTFEWQDAAAIACFCVGWILFPKRIYS